MSSLAVDLAIFERLTGAPLDSHGRPERGVDGLPKNRSVIGPPGRGLLPSYGVVVPIQVGAYKGDRGLTSRDPDALRLFDKGWDRRVTRQVPIFNQNVEGRDWADVWPCVTFRQSDERPRDNTYIYHDPFESFDETSDPVTITNRYGEVIAEGYSKKNVRPHPESVDYYYTFTCYSKSEFEMAWIQNQIRNLFPQKGAIVVQMADGSSLPFDMYEESVRYEDVNDQKATASEEEQKFFKRSYVYRVEAYMDNTVNGFGVEAIYQYENLVRERLLTLMDLQKFISRNTELNSQELQPLE